MSSALDLFLKELNDYSNELNLYTPMSLTNLISSHRRLREEFMKDQKQRSKECDEIRKRAHQLAYDYALNSNFIEIKKLKTMTIKEISDHCYEDN